MNERDEPIPTEVWPIMPTMVLWYNNVGPTYVDQIRISMKKHSQRFRDKWLYSDLVER